MPNSIFSVAIPSSIEEIIFQHLIRKDREEELLFAIWNPSIGESRHTALISEAIFPEVGDRQRHGNVSFNPQYFERVCKIAMQKKAGIAFMHSHPVPGWQDMSQDDINAEFKMAGAVQTLTGLPLVGMTTGSDGEWSARFWQHTHGKEFRRDWCHSVRSSGRNLRVSFNNNLMPAPKYRDEFKRTVTVWSGKHHAQLVRLKIGIVGLGSVGSFVAELLARMGFENLVLIDFDVVKPHNLDRTLSATSNDIGKTKIEVIERMIKLSSTARSIKVTGVPYSIAEKEGYHAALDCDVLFSCVDRPRARRIMNHMAFAHLIPIIDGGIQVRFKDKQFTGVDWQLQTIAHEKPCLECLGAYTNSDVATEIEGKLDDPSYIKGLSETHRFRSNENVIPFSANLASLEVLQLISMVTGAGGINDFGVQRYRYNPGVMERDVLRKCQRDCVHVSLTARGDKDFSLYGECKAANAVRDELI